MKLVVVGNLGTPEASDPKSVARYLREFLMDGYVIDIPFPVRWLLVNCIIAPFRSKKSSHAYEQVWTERGSPLLFNTVDLVAKVQASLGEGYKVVPAMRYGEPSITSVFGDLESYSDIYLLPLYPHFADSSYGTWLKRAKNELQNKLKANKQCKVLEPYYGDSEFIDALLKMVPEGMDASLNSLDKFPDETHLLLSYHGLPNRHVQKLDASGKHCLKFDGCCDKITQVNRNCYRAHCFETSRQIAKALKLRKDQYTTCFQSRLGPNKWISPPTDETLMGLASKGCKHVMIMTPAFSSDCLETIEEVGIGLREEFLSAGGETFSRIDCLNSEDHWADLLSRWVKSDANFSNL